MFIHIYMQYPNALSPNKPRDKSCTKKDLKSLIKIVFDVDAEKINIANVSGKTKRFKGVIGTRKSYKKAVVTIKEGQSINFQGLK